MNLNRENYYSPEANQEYMSNSQYGSFMDCEARALAEIKGEWKDEKPAFEVGDYLHAWNEGKEAMERFIAEHPQCFSSRGATKGQLKSEYQFANRMIATLEADSLCMLALQGAKEVIMTAELFGSPWKIRMDVHRELGSGKRRIADLKSTKSINDLVWSDERWGKVSFVEAYHYPRQLAIYCEIERLATGSPEWAEPLIVAVSKENPPDKAVINMADDKRFTQELAMVEYNMPRILAVKKGLELPKSCGHCEYCRSHKKLNRVIHYSEIGMAS